MNIVKGPCVFEDAMGLEKAGFPDLLATLEWALEQEGQLLERLVLAGKAAKIADPNRSEPPLFEAWLAMDQQKPPLTSGI